MLWTVFVVLVIVWLLGMVTGITLGGVIHVMVLLAWATVLVRVMQGRMPV